MSLDTNHFDVTDGINHVVGHSQVEPDKSQSTGNSPVVLRGLVPGQEYTIRVCTILNGHAIATRAKTYPEQGPSGAGSGRVNTQV